MGPYSHAIEKNGVVYLSGQVAFDQEAKLVGEDAAAQTVQVMKNLRAILNAAGLDFADVVKTTIYLAHFEDFGAVNEVYARPFEQPYPARSTVAVRTLPKNALVEIEVVARAK